MKVSRQICGRDFVVETFKWPEDTTSIDISDEKYIFRRELNQKDITRIHPMFGIDRKLFDDNMFESKDIRLSESTDGMTVESAFTLDKVHKFSFNISPVERTAIERIEWKMGELEKRVSALPVFCKIPITSVKRKID